MRITFALLASASLAAIASAGPIVVAEQAGGTDNLLVNRIHGFGFTTSATGGPWSNIAINFFADIRDTTPTAAGNLYLFTSPYGGTLAQLPTSSPFAVSTGVIDGQYRFGPGVTLLPDTTYYAYTDVTQSVSADQSFGSFVYVGFSFNRFLESDGYGVNYRVSSLPNATAPIPEPISLCVFGGLLVGGGLVARRRLAKA